MGEFDDKSLREDKIIRDQIKSSYRGVFNGDPPWKEEIEQGLNCFVMGARYQHSQDQERIAELEQRSQDRETTIVNLEAELEKFRNWYKLGCKESLDG